MPQPASAAVDPSAPPAAGPQHVPANRRQLLRLRDLCDEVLASHRAAHDSDVISGPERDDARVLLAGMGPQRRG
jgi:hypothetical protein